MAKTTLIKDGFGQLELNQVAFRRDGRVEAQCALDPTDFASIPAENGMILVVDKRNNVIRLPKADDSNVLYALNYTTEHMYDERARGLKNFRLYKDEFYPRVGYLAKGDRFTTNAVRYDTTDFADEDAIKAAIGPEGTGAYGIPGTTGYIDLIDDLTNVTSDVVLEAVKYYTMPDGQPAIKFSVIKA